MTLIQVLFHYQEILRQRGRKLAKQMLMEIMSDDEVIRDVIGTFNDAGEFIDADGFVLRVIKEK